ncbi:RNA polymerase sigma factor [Radiobacillus sp. PE A8.2]|uniref:RNA polymerase sigma factor n=1 Tax=Radiobacillus sp. PE A8.2 TaxID=3380349 RepID=UPI00388ED832
MCTAPSLHFASELAEAVPAESDCLERKSQALCYAGFYFNYQVKNNKLFKICRGTKCKYRLVHRSDSGRGESAISDELLIKKINAGNNQALRVLIERYKHHVFKVVYSVVRDQKQAEDLVQDTFIKMVDALPSYQSQGFKTWLSRIAFHKAIDAKRKQQRSKEDLNLSDQLYSLPSTQSTEQQLLEKEQKIRVRNSVDKLPDKLRSVVWYYYIEELSYEQIAAKLNLERKNVEMRLYRARKWMKANWKEDDF